MNQYIIKEKIRDKLEDWLVIIVGTIIWFLIMVCYWTREIKLAPKESINDDWEELQYPWRHLE